MSDCLAFLGGSKTHGDITEMMAALLQRRRMAPHSVPHLAVSPSLSLFFPELTIYAAGDTIGCGIDFSTYQAFFTKNGTFIGPVFLTYHLVCVDVAFSQARLSRTLGSQLTCTRPLVFAIPVKPFVSTLGKILSNSTLNTMSTNSASRPGPIF
jgi:hypothetical protein